METPLHPNECCVLGSINLSNFHVGNKQDNWCQLSTCDNIDRFKESIDWKRLEETIRIAVRMLDNIIDVQNYPDEEFEKFHKKNRKIGLGIMGFADMLIKLGVVYGDKLSFDISKVLMKYIQRVSHEYSEELAKEKGIPENLQKVPLEKKRNTTVTCIAPTGTLSTIAGCSSGIEPNFAYEIKHNKMDEEYITYHPLYKEFKNIGDPEWDAAFITASEIDFKDHVKMQSIFQKYTDLAVSKTINLPNNASVKDVEEAYELAYKLGCKGITVYRDGSRDNQVLSRNDNKETVIKKEKSDKLPEVMESNRVRINTPEGKVFINISHVKGVPYEVFIHHPAETKYAETYESLARLVSTCLRNNVLLSEVIEQLEKSHKKYGSITSISSSLIKALKLFQNDKIETEKCPECKEFIVLEEGCKKCYNCGYSACN